MTWNFTSDQLNSTWGFQMHLLRCSCSRTLSFLSLFIYAGRLHSLEFNNFRVPAGIETCLASFCRFRWRITMMSERKHGSPMPPRGGWHLRSSRRQNVMARSSWSSSSQTGRYDPKIASSHEIENILTFLNP